MVWFGFSIFYVFAAELKQTSMFILPLFLTFYTTDMFMDSNKMKQPFFGYLDAKNTKKRILTKLMKHKEKKSERYDHDFGA